MLIDVSELPEPRPLHPEYRDDSGTEIMAARHRPVICRHVPPHPATRPQARTRPATAAGLQLIDDLGSAGVVIKLSSRRMSHDGNAIITRNASAAAVATRSEIARTRALRRHHRRHSPVSHGGTPPQRPHCHPMTRMEASFVRPDHGRCSRTATTPDTGDNFVRDQNAAESPQQAKRMLRAKHTTNGGEGLPASPALHQIA